MIGETMARPTAGAGSDALLTVLLHAQEKAMKLNHRMTARLLEMACLDLALESAELWARIEDRVAALRPDPALGEG